MNLDSTATIPRAPRIWLASFAVLLAGSFTLGGAAGAAAPDAQQPYSATRSNPVTYNFDLIVTVTAPYQTKLLRVWLPIPPSDQAQELLMSEFLTFPQTMEPSIGVEPEFGNRFAYFEIHNPQGGQMIRHRMRVKVWELHWNLDPAKVESIATWPDAFAPYLRGEKQAVVIDDRFQKLIAEIVPQRTNPLVDLRNVLDWTERNLTYDHENASLRASSLHALEHRRGHCSDYHGFCAALGRALSQPTRVTYGINTFPKHSPSHCKLEAFLAPYGWVSFDVSETQKLTKAIRGDAKLTDAERDRLVDAAHRRLAAGFRDNTWFLQTRGTDYELVPKASQRVPVVRTIYAEADGKALPDPDPASKTHTGYAWMTAQRIVPSMQVPYPFTDLKSLEPWLATPGTPKEQP